MAIDVNAFARAIRLSVDDIAEGDPLVAKSGRDSEFADASRLLAYCNAAIDRHAPNVPDAIKDEAIVHLGQYLLDAPVAERSRPQSALANSGVRSMLAPYRVHRAGVDVDAVVAGLPSGSGIDRNMVIAIVNELLPSWVEMDIVPIPIAKLSVLPDWVRQTATAIPAGKLGNAPGGMQGATPAQVALIVQALSAISNLEHFRDALRTSGSFNHPRLLIDVAISNAAYRTAGNLKWPKDDADQQITISVNPSPSGTTATHSVDLTTILALPSISPATQMNAQNGIEFQPSDASVKYYIGRSGEDILFAADSIGAYYIALSDTEIDLADWARESSDKLIPADKLTNAPKGLTQAQVNSSIADWAEQGNVDPIPRSKLANAPSITFTDEQNAVFDAFIGDDVWIDSTDVLVGNRIYPSRPSTVVGLALTTTYGPISPRPAANSVLIVAVPLAKVPNVAKGLMRFTVFSTGYVSDVASKNWAQGSADATYRYFAVTVPNIPEDGSVKVEEFQPTMINPDRVGNFYIPESWARQGNTDPIPASKVSVVEQLATQRYSSVYGSAITSLNADRRFGQGSSIVPFTTPLTLTSSDHGLLLVSVQWNVAPDSTPRVALGDDVTGERNIAFHEIVALSDYAVASLNGLLVDTADVHAVSGGSRGAKQGEISLYIGKTSTGEVGFFVNYDADSGAVSVLQGNVQASIDVFSLPSGAPPAQDGGLAYTEVKTWQAVPSSVSAVNNYLTASQWDELLANDVRFIVMDWRWNGGGTVYQTSAVINAPTNKTANIALGFHLSAPHTDNVYTATIFNATSFRRDRKSVV